jgi:hypothetical protein
LRTRCLLRQKSASRARPISVTSLLIIAALYAVLLMPLLICCSGCARRSQDVAALPRPDHDKRLPAILSDTRGSGDMHTGALSGWATVMGWPASHEMRVSREIGMSAGNAFKDGNYGAPSNRGSQCPSLQQQRGNRRGRRCARCAKRMSHQGHRALVPGSSDKQTATCSGRCRRSARLSDRVSTTATHRHRHLAKHLDSPALMSRCNRCRSSTHLLASRRAMSCGVDTITAPVCVGGRRAMGGMHT